MQSRPLAGRAPISREDGSTRGGVEQWQLARLITWRSVVQIHSPQLKPLPV
jgi:hypothetical protein